MRPFLTLAGAVGGAWLALALAALILTPFYLLHTYANDGVIFLCAVFGALGGGVAGFVFGEEKEPGK